MLHNVSHGYLDSSKIAKCFFFLVSSSDSFTDPSFSGDEIEMTQFEQTRQINLRERIIKSKHGITEKYVFESRKSSKRKNEMNLRKIEYFIIQ